MHDRARVAAQGRQGRQTFSILDCKAKAASTALEHSSVPSAQPLSSPHHDPLLGQELVAEAVGLRREARAGVHDERPQLLHAVCVGC